MKKTVTALLVILTFALQLVACGSTIPRSGEDDVSEKDEDFYLEQCRDAVAAIENANFMYPAQDEILSYDVYDTMAVVTGFSNAIKNKEVTYHSEKKLDLDIPSEYNGVPVRIIDEFAFDDTFSVEWQIENLTLPDTLWVIGKSAFWGQEKCRIEGLPDSIFEIGEGAFYNCSLCEGLIIPDSVFSIGESAFSVTGINYVYIGANVPYIPEGAFSNSALIYVEIPKHITEIQAYAFSHANNLRSVTLYNPNTVIDSSAFWGCSSDMVLNGYAGSTAAYYSSEKGYSFGIIIDDAQGGYGYTD